MAAAVATLNSYTKTIIEMKHRARMRLEEARAASCAPSYEEVVGAGGGGTYSVSQLMQLGQQGVLIDPTWPRGVGPAVGPLACGVGGALLVGGGGIGVGSLGNVDVGMGMGGVGVGEMEALAGVGGNGVGMGMGGVGGTMGGVGRLMDHCDMVVVEGCGAEGCEDCEQEMNEMDYALQDDGDDSIC